MDRAQMAYLELTAGLDCKQELFNAIIFITMKLTTKSILMGVTEQYRMTRDRFFWENVTPSNKKTIFQQNK